MWRLKSQVVPNIHRFSNWNSIIFIGRRSKQQTVSIGKVKYCHFSLYFIVSIRYIQVFVCVTRVVFLRLSFSFFSLPFGTDVPFLHVIFYIFHFRHIPTLWCILWHQKELSHWTSCSYSWYDWSHPAKSSDILSILVRWPDGAIYCQNIRIQVHLVQQMGKL